jgi:hypothetical protein
MIPAEIAKRPKTKQKTQRKENCPVNSGEIIEISSDEDEVSVAPRNGVAMSKLHEKIKQLEQVLRVHIHAATDLIPHR